MTTLISVETTPNPNSMKLNLSEPLTTSGTFTTDNLLTAPAIVQKLLQIPGIQSIFGAASFVTINRDPRSDWETILHQAKSFLTGDGAANLQHELQADSTEGQVQVFVQTFRDIPIQIKVSNGLAEQRIGLPERFGNTARELQTHCGADYLKERHWADWGVRYGELTEVAHEVAEEIEAIIDTDKLDKLKQQALSGLPVAPKTSTKIKSQTPNLDNSDWHVRFQAIQNIEATEETLHLLIQGLQDPQPQIRRWVTARLASIKTAESVAALADALINDTHVGVRRTAGDSLSDIGDVAAEWAVCRALSDSNKLVRWRAARFLAEAGTEAALPYLEQAKNDPEYEVQLEIEAAIKHISEGSKLIPVWKRMAQDT